MNNKQSLQDNYICPKCISKLTASTHTSSSDVYSQFYCTICRILVHIYYLFGLDEEGDFDIVGINQIQMSLFTSLERKWSKRYVNYFHTNDIKYSYYQGNKLTIYTMNHKIDFSSPQELINNLFLILIDMMENEHIL